MLTPEEATLVVYGAIIDKLKLQIPLSSKLSLISDKRKSYYSKIEKSLLWEIHLKINIIFSILVIISSKENVEFREALLRNAFHWTDFFSSDLNSSSKIIFLALSSVSRFENVSSSAVDKVSSTNLFFEAISCISKNLSFWHSYASL